MTDKRSRPTPPRGRPKAAAIDPQHPRGTPATGKIVKLIVGQGHGYIRLADRPQQVERPPPARPRARHPPHRRLRPPLLRLPLLLVPQRRRVQLLPRLRPASGPW